MNQLITLSERSKKIIAELCKVTDDVFVTKMNMDTIASIECNQLTYWLNQTVNHEKQSRFGFEDLRAALLADLYDSVLTDKERKEKNETQPTSRWQRSKFGLLAIAGTLLAVCEGFDGIASLLKLLSAPAAAVFSVGAAFSVLSVVVFYGFDLVEISKNLGVSIKNSPKLIDVFLDQVEQIKQLQAKIDHLSTNEDTTDEELSQFKPLVAMLKIRYESLNQARAAYDHALNRPGLKLIKSITAVVSGVLFFGGGFFAGQSLALVIAGLFMAAVPVVFIPAITIGIAAGLGAFCIYWFVQRPGLENLVGRSLGLDKDKIEVLGSAQAVTLQLETLSLLDKKIDYQIKLRQPKVTITPLKPKSKEMSTQTDQIRPLENTNSPRVRILITPTPFIQSYPNSIAKSIQEAILNLSNKNNLFFKPDPTRDQPKQMLLAIKCNSTD